MADINAFDQEQNVLSNVGGVVGDPLQIMSYKNQIECSTHRVFAAIRLLKQLAIDRVLELVDFVVGEKDGLRHLLVPLHKGIKAAADHGLHKLGHSRDIDAWPRRSTVQERRGSLGHVDHQIAHPLQVAVDLDCRCQEAEILRHRLVQGRQPNCNLIDFDIELVNPVLDLPDFRCGRISALYQP